MPGWGVGADGTGAAASCWLLKQVDTQLPRGPATRPPGASPAVWKARTGTDLLPRAHTADACPSVYDRVREPWPVHTVGCHQPCGTPAVTWTKLEGTMCREMSHT